MHKLKLDICIVCVTATLYCSKLTIQFYIQVLKRAHLATAHESASVVEITFGIIMNSFDTLSLFTVL